MGCSGIDEADDLLLSIDRNDSITGDPAPSDLRCESKWLRMQMKHRSIAIEIDARGENVGLLTSGGRAFACRSYVIEGVSSTSGVPWLTRCLPQST
jgi:hypothetical protein